MSIIWPWSKLKASLEPLTSDPFTDLMFKFQQDLYDCERKLYDADCVLNEMLQHRGIFVAGGRPTRRDLIDAGLLPTPPFAIEEN